MLIKCPECELQISDKCLSCPHCGYPFSSEVKPTVRRRNKNKRKRLPNGFGQISEIKNSNLRNRFRVMVTVGMNEKGKYITKMLKPQAYFPTYNDAYSALVEYNRHPYDLDSQITVSELYERWTNVYFKQLKSSTSHRTITSAWYYCSSVYNMRVVDLRARHIKYCMEEGSYERKGKICKPSPSTKSRIKSLFNLMLDYALEYELVDRNYARTFDISDDILDEAAKAKRSHMAFTDDELDILWNNVNSMQYVDLILINCYMGWRPQELGHIKVSDVNLDDWVIVGGMKTEAGTDRPVPIHKRIRNLIEKYYEEAMEMNSEYLFNCTDVVTHRGSLKMTYDKYNYRFEKIMSALGLNSNHRPHDPRVTFVTIAKKYKLDEYAIKYIVGHKIQDLTESTYTKRTIDFLVDEISKIE